jgi:anaerobic ribonucleoside-triphosphate reductase activating protein
MAVLRVGARLAETTTEGPGARYALWLQGCSLRCAGCCNPHLFDPQQGEAVEVGVMLGEVASAGRHIEGVTVLGGEPFDQAEALALFVRGVRELDLGVIVFTGFTLEDLVRKDDPAIGDILAATDLLIDGPFDGSRPEIRRMWVGSANQRFHYLTGRYASSIEEGPEGRLVNQIEVRIDVDGHIRLNGWPLGI